MSSNSLKSHWVQSELQVALASRKPIFPILLEGKKWLAVTTIQHVNATNGELPPKAFFEKIASVVSVDIKSQPEIRYPAQSLKKSLSSSKTQKTHEKEKRLIFFRGESFDLNDSVPFSIFQIEMFSNADRTHLADAIYEVIEVMGIENNTYGFPSISRSWQDLLMWLEKGKLRKRKDEGSDKHSKVLSNIQKQTKIVIEGRIFDLLSPFSRQKIQGLSDGGIIKLGDFAREHSVEEGLIHKSWIDWIKF